MPAALGSATTAVFPSATTAERLSVPVASVLTPAIAGPLVGAKPGRGSTTALHGRDHKPAVRRWRHGVEGCRTDGGRPRATSPGEA
jgi:hypothetical protein